MKNTTAEITFPKARYFCELSCLGCIANYRAFEALIPRPLLYKSSFNRFPMTKKKIFAENRQIIHSGSDIGKINTILIQCYICRNHSPSCVNDIFSWAPLFFFFIILVSWSLDKQKEMRLISKKINLRTDSMYSIVVFWFSPVFFLWEITNS